MKSELAKLAEAQERISKINDEIFEKEIKIKKLEKIKNNKQLFIRETCESDLTYYGPYDFGSRSQCIIKSIKIYNYRNTKYPDTVSVDMTSYFTSTFSKVIDFLSNSDYIIVNENDPLWDILVTDYIKKLEDIIKDDKAKIEEIKNRLTSEGE